MHSHQQRLRSRPSWVKSLDTELQVFSCRDDDRQIHEISLYSWNILSQYLFDSTPQWYQYVAKNAPLQWKDRLPKIIDELVKWNADVICLQEVEFYAFDDLQTLLQEYGYNGVMQSSKKRTGQHPYGVCTFYKEEKFKLVETIHRSRVMVSMLQLTTVPSQNILAVMNVHLEGAPSKSITRVRQLQNAFQDIKNKHVHHDVVILGDFNCILGKSACSIYLKEGTCSNYDHILEWGRLVDSQIASIPKHTYNFHSAYNEHRLRESPMDYITFVSSPHRYTAGLDQIWYHDENDSIRVKGLKKSFSSYELREKILNSGLPSIYHPSDHIGIGCILEFDESKYETRENLQAKEPVHFNAKRMSTAELEETATQLLSTIDFEGKDEFLSIIKNILNVPSGGKPSDKEIQQIRSLRLRKKELLESLPKEERDILMEVSKLLKVANSRYDK